MFINTETLQYPISEQSLREYFANISFPKPFLCPDGYAYVFDTPKPEYDKVSQTIVEDTPVLTNKGHWEQQWKIVPRFIDYTDQFGVIHTSQEQLVASETNRLSQLASAIRKQRNQLLADSDWTQVEDTPVERTAWAAYRQQLRDLTDQLAFPSNIEWPIKPY